MDDLMRDLESSEPMTEAQASLALGGMSEEEFYSHCEEEFLKYDHLFSNPNHIIDDSRRSNVNIRIRINGDDDDGNSNIDDDMNITTVTSISTTKSRIALSDDDEGVEPTISINCACNEDDIDERGLDQKKVHDRYHNQEVACKLISSPDGPAAREDLDICSSSSSSAMNNITTGGLDWNGSPQPAIVLDVTEVKEEATSHRSIEGIKLSARDNFSSIGTYTGIQYKHDILEEKVRHTYENLDNKSATKQQSLGLCVICLDEPITYTIIPCGHECGCRECLANLQRLNQPCPICRVPIDNLFKVYRVGFVDSAANENTLYPHPSDKISKSECSASLVDRIIHVGNDTTTDNTTTHNTTTENSVELMNDKPRNRGQSSDTMAETEERVSSSPSPSWYLSVKTGKSMNKVLISMSPSTNMVFDGDIIGNYISEEDEPFEVEEEESVITAEDVVGMCCSSNSNSRSRSRKGIAVVDATNFNNDEDEEDEEEEEEIDIF